VTQLYLQSLSSLFVASCLSIAESESESLYNWRYRQSVRLGAKLLETQGQIFFSELNTCGHSPYVTSSLTRGWVCCFQLLLVLASAFILRSESSRTDDHILLFRIRDFPNLEARFLYLYPPEIGWPTYTPDIEFPFRRFLSQIHIATDRQSINLGVEPHLRLIQIFITL
jgi:hypothetical protein